MAIKHVEIINSSQSVVATAEIENKGNYYSGLVNLALMPEELRHKFEEYESLVNDQVLSLLDQIQEEIGIDSFLARFDDGRKFCIEDLQVFPKSGMISFKVPRLVSKIVN